MTWFRTWSTGCCDYTKDCVPSSGTPIHWRRGKGTKFVARTCAHRTPAVLHLRATEERILNRRFRKECPTRKLFHDHASLRPGGRTRACEAALHDPVYGSKRPSSVSLLLGAVGLSRPTYGTSTSPQFSVSPVSHRTGGPAWPGTSNLMQPMVIS